MGNIRRILVVMVLKPGLLKLIAFNVVLLIFTISAAFSQCPGFSSKNTNISVDQSSGTVSISTSSETDFRSVRILIWNFDDKTYYFDSGHIERTKENISVNVRINSKDLMIKRLPPGDYSVVVEKAGCKLNQIGLGYSGLPDSGIKIE